MWNGSILTKKLRISIFHSKNRTHYNIQTSLNSLLVEYRKRMNRKDKEERECLT
jgi:hypothetical protein